MTTQRLLKKIISYDRWPNRIPRGCNLLHLQIYASGIYRFFFLLFFLERHTGMCVLGGYSCKSQKYLRNIEL